jgi:hypothetical protein
MADGQCLQTTQVMKPNVFSLFYQTQVSENNIYHVTCKLFFQDHHLTSWDDDDEIYDYEFFFQDSKNSTMMYYVTCKLLSNSLIVNMLNKEVYGMDFDGNELKRRYLLTLHQKLYLEQNLKQILPFYLSQQSGNEKNRIQQFEFSSLYQ